MKRAYVTLTAAAALSLVAGTATAVTGSTAVTGPSRQGPSSSQTPYVLGEHPSVSTTSILSVGDEVDDYPFVGIPDGLGAYDNGDGTFTVLANHELPAGQGAVHAHGAKGSFISKWTIKNNLQAVAGEDLIKRVKTWDGSAWKDSVVEFSRFCSSDLPADGTFFDAASGKGTKTRLYLTGEEAGADGRGTATVVDGDDAGTTYVLPWLGRYSFENVVAFPGSGEKTVVVGLDDSGGGQVYVYIGEKRATGNDVERAGLVGGKLYGLKIDGVPVEDDATTVPAEGASFSLVEIPGAAELTGAELEAKSTELGVSKLARPEDGAWDPTHVGGFYFATTGSFKGISRLWHLDFADPSKPEAGGTATIPLASPAYDPKVPDAEQAGPRMIDNLTINDRGQLLLQEDPGSNDYLSGVFRFDPKTGDAARIARHDADRFAPGSVDFLTRDEESSGIIPVPFLGKGKYLLDVQAHYPTGDPVTVQGGQLLLMHVPPGKPIR
ncbi:MAG TPA: alkaline phosphatase PhoX [Actinomycetales bacterium]|nr:alkaline phosphatase PhoX [Actinomycetales bacterium]